MTKSIKGMFQVGHNICYWTHSSCVIHSCEPSHEYVFPMRDFLPTFFCRYGTFPEILIDYQNVNKFIKSD